MDVSELQASDERVIDSMVEERKRAFDQVEGDLASKFDAMQVRRSVCSPSFRKRVRPHSPQGLSEHPRLFLPGLRVDLVFFVDGGRRRM